MPGQIRPPYRTTFFLILFVFNNIEMVRYRGLRKKINHFCLDVNFSPARVHMLCVNSLEFRWFSHNAENILFTFNIIFVMCAFGLSLPLSHSFTPDLINGGIAVYVITIAVVAAAAVQLLRSPFEYILSFSFFKRHFDGIDSSSFNVKRWIPVSCTYLFFSLSCVHFDRFQTFSIFWTSLKQCAGLLHSYLGGYKIWE